MPPPHGLCIWALIGSGRPGSNRRQPAWEAGTLPTELRPQTTETLANWPTLSSHIGVWSHLWSHLLDVQWDQLQHARHRLPRLVELDRGVVLAHLLRDMAGDRLGHDCIHAGSPRQIVERPPQPVDREAIRDAGRLETSLPGLDERARRAERYCCGSSTPRRRGEIISNASIAFAM